MQHAVARSNDLLSLILKKSLFYKRYFDKTLSERQRKVLNIYLDGYEGFLTVKNWAKLSNVSQDTAMRDIKDLVDKRILLPQNNEKRNIKYTINIED